MADEIIKRDKNTVPVLAGITNDVNQYITMLRVDPTTKRLLINATVSGVVVTSFNGLTGAVTLEAGTNITLTPVGNTITIDATSALSEVFHDLSLQGAGTEEDPLSVIGFDLESGEFALQVRLATTAALPGTYTYDNGSSGVGATLTRTTNGTPSNIDGVSPQEGDRILIKNQTTTLRNGVYEMTSRGTSTTPTVYTRTTDADETAEMDDMVVVASAGTTNRGIPYGQQTNNPTIGTSAIVFTATGLFVRQQTSGTQVANQIPVYTGTALTITKGTSNFTYNPSTLLLITDNTTYNTKIQSGAGASATNATDSIFIGRNSGNAATDAVTSVFLGYYAGYQASSAASAIFLGNEAGYGSTGGYSSIFQGKRAGYGATNAYQSVFIGLNAGDGATSAADSVFIGHYAGYQATTLDGGLFLGWQAGYQATTASQGVFLGYQAGQAASVAGFSTFIGSSAGQNATNASGAFFQGYQAGYGATNAANCIFIGTEAGKNTTIDTTSAGSSILIGNYASNGNFKDSIAIGAVATNTAVNQLMIGAATSLINDARIIGTGGLKVPVGTTGERIAVQGMIRYNTTTSKFEGYDGAGWVDFH